MTELKRFRPGQARLQSIPFNFDRASLELLAQHKHHALMAANLPSFSEWKDPPLLRLTSVVGETSSDEQACQPHAVNR